MRKHVERASHDLRAVITTYEGKHNHDVPAARGSGNHSVTRPLPNNTANAIRPSAVTHQHHHNTNNNSLQSLRPQQAPDQVQSSPFTLEMLQQNQGGFGFSSGFGNSMGSYNMNNQQQQQLPDNVFSSRAKEEPRDDTFFDSLLC